MDQKFKLFKTIVPESQKLQEIVNKYKDEYRAILKDLLTSEQDFEIFEDMALEAAQGSPEMQIAWKEVLAERKKERDAREKKEKSKTVIDNAGNIMKPDDIFSGERDDFTKN